MRPGGNWATKGQNYVWQTGSSSDAWSGCELEILIRFLWDTLGVSSMIVLEAHDTDDTDPEICWDIDFDK